jgi:hypothetical protein
MDTKIRIQEIASELLAHYGDDALVEARERAELMRAYRSQEGLRVWSEVADHVESLQVSQLPRTL